MNKYRIQNRRFVFIVRHIYRDASISDCLTIDPIITTMSWVSMYAMCKTSYLEVPRDSTLINVQLCVWSEYSLQREQDAKAGEEDHGKEAVAEDTGHAAEGHAGHAHEVEQAVHGHAADGADPVDVAKLDLTRLGESKAEERGITCGKLDIVNEINVYDSIMTNFTMNTNSYSKDVWLYIYIYLFFIFFY